ncbi:hypothetical protein [Streptomyces rubradiris]|uniref:Uncharacterized protein n=1 Tax=Streptomyces rubradiris TaxID=285531 RepID=A0ABQ3R9B1_STRRR|nr:hypothetical protein [Streptomyces rubradiris]GHG99722.1 hypothetical protein GCM10018792_13350 [Streptomyces rubradiris]GHI52434.1 hypothetical protein Srubr_22800 [Streptomyces rubradiris]
MPAHEITELDTLISDLEERITDEELPSADGYSEGCSGLCTIVICATVIICG